MDCSIIRFMKQADSFRLLAYIKVWVGIGVVCLTSCTTKNLCIEPTLVTMRGGFYYTDTSGVFKDSLVKNVNMVFGSSLNYYQNIKKFNKFNFPLSQGQDSVLTIFQSDSSVVDENTVDSIHWYYTRNLAFISTACGYQTNFTLVSVKYTRHVLDSIVIHNSAVSSDANVEHVKLILKTP